jgi:hypothetical protein
VTRRDVYEQPADLATAHRFEVLTKRRDMPSIGKRRGVEVSPRGAQVHVQAALAVFLPLTQRAAPGQFCLCGQREGAIVAQ